MNASQRTQVIEAKPKGFYNLHFPSHCKELLEQKGKNTLGVHVIEAKPEELQNLLSK
jgi:hypothetical protein